MFANVHTNTNISLPIYAFKQGVYGLFVIIYFSLTLREFLLIPPLSQLRVKACLSSTAYNHCLSLASICYPVWFVFVDLVAVSWCSRIALSQQSSCSVFSQEPEESQRQSNTIKHPLSLFNSRQFLSLMSLHCFILSAAIISDFGHIPVLHSHSPSVQWMRVCVCGYMFLCVCFQLLAALQLNNCPLFSSLCVCIHVWVCISVERYT